MTLLASAFLHIGILIVGISGVFVGRKYFKAKDDSAFEELVERQIQRETGIDIDLTPCSPEETVDQEDKNPSKPILVDKIEKLLSDSELVDK